MPIIEELEQQVEALQQKIAYMDFVIAFEEKGIEIAGKELGIDIRKEYGARVEAALKKDREA